MKEQNDAFTRSALLKAIAFGSHFVVYQARLRCHKCNFSETVEIDPTLAEPNMDTMFLIYFKAVTGCGWIVNDDGLPVVAFCPSCAKDPDLRGLLEKSVKRFMGVK